MNLNMTFVGGYIFAGTYCVSVDHISLFQFNSMTSKYILHIIILTAINRNK